MRLWSLHPRYLDTKGLVALWREALLAKHVLEGKTKGYRNHPQLIRFKNSPFPLDAMNYYLKAVFEESLLRGYHFDNSKFTQIKSPVSLTTTTGQIDFEAAHLLAKLKKRDHPKYAAFLKNSVVEPHPLFTVIPGDVEAWEKTAQD